MNEEGKDEVVCACPLCGQAIPSKTVKKTIFKNGLLMFIGLIIGGIIVVAVAIINDLFLK